METQEKPKVSLLLPTRKRVAILKKSLESLETYTKNFKAVEILIAVDKDDFDTQLFLKELVFPIEIRTFIFERKGYLRLHEYMNELAPHANGDWLMLWNDDAKMLTLGWENKIIAHTGWFGLLRAQCVTFPSHPFALFPIIPKEWITFFGTFSPVTHNDWWAYNVAAPLGRMKNINVNIYHDRFDLTGANNDQTYKEQDYGHDGQNPNHPDDYSHPDRIKDLHDWRQKLLTREN